MVLAWVGILSVTMFILLFEMPRLVSERLVKESIIFSVLLLMGVTLSVFQVYRVSIPNPIYWISMVFTPISNWIDHYLL
ncbi:hypothetical protein [Niallia oryzisoli]|uniref:hypothetical protein n=1 Tax=Niallia oryzisoli TaxID=1737571 RepID=UPI0037357B1A